MDLALVGRSSLFYTQVPMLLRGEPLLPSLQVLRKYDDALDGDALPSPLAQLPLAPSLHTINLSGPLALPMQVLPFVYQVSPGITRLDMVLINDVDPLLSSYHRDIAFKTVMLQIAVFQSLTSLRLDAHTLSGSLSVNLLYHVLESLPSLTQLFLSPKNVTEDNGGVSSGNWRAVCSRLDTFKLRFGSDACLDSLVGALTTTLLPCVTDIIFELPERQTAIEDCIPLLCLPSLRAIRFSTKLTYHPTSPDPSAYFSNLFATIRKTPSPSPVNLSRIIILSLNPSPGINV
jgi:hypothetical protein